MVIRRVLIKLMTRMVTKPNLNKIKILKELQIRMEIRRTMNMQTTKTRIRRRIIRLRTQVTKTRTKMMIMITTELTKQTRRKIRKIHKIKMHTMRGTRGREIKKTIRIRTEKRGKTIMIHTKT